MPSPRRGCSPPTALQDFDARADGYVRGEGCGVVVLKRLADALADGDRIHAVIRGTAVNQDGRSNGLTAPNGPAQEAVIRAALPPGRHRRPAEVDYVEAHGTGTPLGDPIEVDSAGRGLRAKVAAATGRAAGRIGEDEHRPPGGGGRHRRPDQGRARAAAPSRSRRTFIFEKPNPADRRSTTLPLEIADDAVPWPAGRAPRLGRGQLVRVRRHERARGRRGSAGGGCGAGGGGAPAHVLCLSARSEPALRELARRYVAHLSGPYGWGLGDVCYTANVGRAHFEHRVAVRASSLEEVQGGLEAFVSGEGACGVERGEAAGGGRSKVAFLFTGQGSHYEGMGRELYETQPLFRRTLEQCEEILRPYLEEPLLSVLYSGDGRGARFTRRRTRSRVVSVEYALAELWRSWGIEPDVVMGHSVGEYVAACVAGVFSLEDGLRLTAERGRLMQGLPRDGEMYSVLAEESRVGSALAPYRGEASVAGINGPRSVVISGRREAVRSVVALLGSEGVKAQRLQVSHAFHSPLMEPMLEEFARVAGEVSYRAAHTALVSNVSGRLSESENTRAEYWCRHVREAVRFAEGMQSLHQEGCEIFVEVGPKPTLLGMGRLCLADAEAVWLPSLREGRSDWCQLLESLGRLYVGGAAVDWGGSTVSTSVVGSRCRRIRSSVAATGSRPLARRSGGRMLVLRSTRGVEARSWSCCSKVKRSVWSRRWSRRRDSQGARQHLPEVVGALIERHRRQVSARALDEWFYELRWRAKARVEKAGQGVSLLRARGWWLILADRGGVGEATAALLEARGQSCVVVFAGSGYGKEFRRGVASSTRSIARISRVCSRRRWREARWD